MDTSTKTGIEDELGILEYWKQIPLDDMVPMILNQKVDDSINLLKKILGTFPTSPNDDEMRNLSFGWSLSVRDFALLMRDALLGATKYDQFLKDDKQIDPSLLVEIQSILQHASKELLEEYQRGKESNASQKEWVYQESPVKAIINQLLEIQKQSKKIFRSNSKIDEIRFNISEYLKDFQLQYYSQTNAVDRVLEVVDELKEIVASISSNSSEEKIHKTIELVGDKSQELELIQDTESIDILPYSNKESLSIPVSTSEGNLNFKVINVKAEFARWFSSIIYPKIIELESKREHAIEKCLHAFGLIRAKIASVSLSDIENLSNLQKDFEGIFTLLENDILKKLKKEEEETNELVLEQQSSNLKASNVYNEDLLFLPDNESSPIANLSKDAKKRIERNFYFYKKEVLSYLNKILSRYIEIDKTPYSHYIKNKLVIYEEDDSLALFFKKGYMGKSFTVHRPEIVDSIVDDYNLWADEFAGSILLTGLTGSGKSTILGVLSHRGLNEEIIQIKIGESYFIQHRPYRTTFDIKVLIEEIVNMTQGRRIIICVDDLEFWHNKENELYDNVNKLLDAIVKYRKKIFFIVTCSPFLRERIETFKDLSSVFAKQIEMTKMSAKQITQALNLRVRVTELGNIEKEEKNSEFGNIIRESNGNIGFALLEYCRFCNENYKTNVKSQEFIHMIQSHHTLLMYICAFHHCSIKNFSNSLSEMDFKNTIKSIDHLVGQKILVRPKKGLVAIHPLLVHSVEDALFKFKNR